MKRCTQKSRGFTLIEILVAMSVLTLMLVMMNQMFSLISSAWLNGKARADNFTQARNVLGLIDRDVRSMVVRKDLAAFKDDSGNTACAFYSRQKGADKRPLSLVQYFLDTPTTTPRLTRRMQSFSFSNTAAIVSPKYGTLTSLGDIASATSDPVVDGVIGFGMRFSDANGTVGNVYNDPYEFPDDPTNTRLVIVTLLVLDKTSYQATQKAGKLPSLVSSFPEPPTNVTHSSTWKNILNNATWVSGQPESVRRGLRVFERRIALPNEVVK